jgi:ATP-dependent DNA ligase
MENLRAFPAGTSIDGELYVPGKPASYVKTAIKEQDEYLAFVPFAVPYYRGEDLTAEGLHRACDLVVGKGLPFSPYKAFDEVLGSSVAPLAFNPASELAAAVADGQEGVVFKQSNYAGWWKLKEDRTIDLIVTGVKAGKGKYQGLIGSLLCSTTEGVEVAKVSGMSDKARREMTAEMQVGELTGRICEVKFQLVGSRGRLRHPRFLRWRPDKLTEDCGLAQDIELLEKWSSEK